MNYLISATISPYGEEAPDHGYETDPENAIMKWRKFSEKYPTCASIQAKTEEDGILRWALDNFDKVEGYMRKHKVPYKPEWIKKQVKSYDDKNLVLTHKEAADIVELFEIILVKNNIKLPSPEDAEREPENDAALYGSVYDGLLSSVEDILINITERVSKGAEVIPDTFSVSD